MISKINSSLFSKVFLFTAFLLVLMSVLVYGLLAWFTPHSYSNELNDSLDAQARAFAAELEQVSMQDSGGLFDLFLQNNAVSCMELYTDQGECLPLPTNRKDTSEADTAQETVVVEASTFGYETAPTLSSRYSFSFQDSDTRYLLTVYGEAARIAELRHSFVRMLPVLLFFIIIFALIFSILYSHMITKPVLKISRIAKEISALHLNWDLDGKRSDELGTLEKNLHFLSQKLSATLSELQSANRQLKKDILREKELEQARLDFFSAASHELKTPITVIKGQLEGMLLGVGAYRDHGKYLRRSLETSKILESMVEEILTLSRLETDEADLKTENFDCISLIRHYVSETEDTITENGINLRLSLPSSAPVGGNRFLIEKVFSNLIGNAVKYSPQNAEISVSVEEGPQKYTFSVANTGTHIPEEDLPKLFDAFFRTDPSRNRATGGSGLGLYIVQKILLRHGSECTAENTPHGVLFSFDLRKTSAEYEDVSRKP